MKFANRTAMLYSALSDHVGICIGPARPNRLDHQANFSKYRPIRGRKPSRNSLWDARIKMPWIAVDRQGIDTVDNGGDVSIVAIKTTRTERTLQTFYDGFGGGWRGVDSVEWVRRTTTRTGLQRRNPRC